MYPGLVGAATSTTTAYSQYQRPVHTTTETTTEVTTTATTTQLHAVLAATPTPTPSPEETAHTSQNNSPDPFTEDRDFSFQPMGIQTATYQERAVALEELKERVVNYQKTHPDMRICFEFISLPTGERLGVDELEPVVPAGAMAIPFEIAYYDSIAGTTEYTYDALGQLLTETVDGVVVNTMTYDNYGNILQKNGKVYTYGNAAWKDLLTSYNGQAISYDAQGNPLNYLGHTLTWEKGRQLKTFDGIAYTYNANGIRTSKTVGGVPHEYLLDGVNILRETWGGNVLETLYDNEDTVCGIIYNGVPYYFHKNLQGDIIAIADQNGKVVARYTYDAWGVCTILSDTSGCSISTVNPYRYRGYYFDTETGMYYLQTRYYDPETGRFINADDAAYAIAKALHAEKLAFLTDIEGVDNGAAQCTIVVVYLWTLLASTATTHSCHHWLLLRCYLSEESCDILHNTITSNRAE